MAVILESAGTHHFDLGHLRRQGAEDMVERLLRRAGLDPALPWRLQVQKKLLCNSETPPLRVVDEPKKWAVYLKVKPGDNNSCHYCSLLMPDGLQGSRVYPELKRVEKELDRNWKHSSGEKGPMTALENGATSAESSDNSVENELDRDDTLGSREIGRLTPIEIGPLAKGPSSVPAEAANGPASPKPTAGAPNATGNAKGWIGDPDKTRLVLMAIQEIHTTGFVTSQDHFVQLLCAKLGWDGVNRYQVGGVFTSMVRKELIMRVLRGSKPVGYALTDAGWALIRDLLEPATPPPAAVVAPSPVDLARTLRSFGPLAEQFVEAHHRLEEIASREDELTAELDLLREERDGICNRLANEEVHRLLARLLEVRPATGSEKSAAAR